MKSIFFAVEKIFEILILLSLRSVTLYDLIICLDTPMLPSIISQFFNNEEISFYKLIMSAAQNYSQIFL